MRVVKFARHMRGLPPVTEVEELDAVILGGSLLKGGLTRIVSEVETSVVVLGAALEEVSSVSIQRFEENEKENRALMGAVQNLFATLGPTVEIDAKLEAPTLWGTTAFMAEEVVQLGGAVAKLESEMAPLSTAIREVTELQQRTEERILKNRNQSAEALGFVMTHVRKVGGKLKYLGGAIRRLEANEGGGRPSGGSPTKVSEFGDLEDSGDPLLDEMRSKAG